jgi:hypothetical protein
VSDSDFVVNSDAATEFVANSEALWVLEVEIMREANLNSECIKMEF